MNRENLHMYGEAYSVGSLRGRKHAFSFNCRELVMTVNISVQKRNATVRLLLARGV